MEVALQNVQTKVLGITQLCLIIAVIIWLLCSLFLILSGASLRILKLYSLQRSRMKNHASIRCLSSQNYQVLCQSFPLPTLSFCMILHGRKACAPVLLLCPKSYLSPLLPSMIPPHLGPSTRHKNQSTTSTLFVRREQGRTPTLLSPCHCCVLPGCATLQVLDEFWQRPWWWHIAGVTPVQWSTGSASSWSEVVAVGGRLSGWRVGLRRQTVEKISCGRNSTKQCTNTLIQQTVPTIPYPQIIKRVLFSEFNVWIDDGYAELQSMVV